MTTFFQPLPNDKAILKSVVKKEDPWESKEWQRIKSELKRFLLHRVGDRCCYCLRTLRNQHGLTIDIEHVLPKKKVPKHIFSVKNLSIACKRCNMTIKNDDTSFFDGHLHMRRPFKSKYYKIIHPNIDKLDNHLYIDFHQIKNKILIKYIMTSNPKAKYTYEYFRLKEIEISTLNIIQGVVFKELSNKITPNDGAKVMALLASQ